MTRQENNSATAHPAKRRRIFVEVRRLTSDERAAYTSPTLFTMQSASPIEIVGEFNANGEDLYFARTEDGLAHRVRRHFVD
jgi:hypothetical protein